jgi:hypothetical protein
LDESKQGQLGESFLPFHQHHPLFDSSSSRVPNATDGEGALKDIVGGILWLFFTLQTLLLLPSVLTRTT